jgi:hypothetical protein
LQGGCGDRCLGSEPKAAPLGVSVSSAGSTAHQAGACAASPASRRARQQRGSRRRGAPQPHAGQPPRRDRRRPHLERLPVPHAGRLEPRREPVQRARLRGHLAGGGVQADGHVHLVARVAGLEAAVREHVEQHVHRRGVVREQHAPRRPLRAPGEAAAAQQGHHLRAQRREDARKEGALAGGVVFEAGDQLLARLGGGGDVDAKGRAAVFECGDSTLSRPAPPQSGSCRGPGIPGGEARAPAAAARAPGAGRL